MKPYIFSILFLASLNIAFSQTKVEILNQSFSANENTILNLDLDNVAVVFEESFDGKIYFDYNIFFGRYSKKKREAISKEVNATVFKKDNLVNLTVNNSMFMRINHESNISMDSLKVALKDYVDYEKSNKFKYKTKDSIIKEIRNSEGSNLTDFLTRKKINYEDNNFIRKNKILVKVFTIKAPKNIQIRLKAINSTVIVIYDLSEKFTANTFKGNLKFKKILSKENRIIASNGIFQAEKIENGRMEFLDMHKVVIGEISKMSIATETSRIQIGEVGESVDFIDFNSKLYLYNFNENFTKFNLTGDYTELNLYKVKETNFSMDVSGFNTTLNINGTKTSFGASKEKYTKILQKKKNESSPFLGNIEVILKNGILNFK
jgi:hypothetical protein